MKNANAISFSLVIICFLFSLGCSTNTNTDESACVIYIIGNHSNSQVFSIPLADDLTTIYSNGGLALFIELDGTPNFIFTDENTVLGDLSEMELESSQTQLEKNSDYWDKYVFSPLLDSIELEITEKAMPDSPEVDLLTAFEKASDGFDIKSDQFAKKIIVYDTGLSTSGIINFTEEILNKDKSEIDTLISTLKSEGYLPDLSDVSIQWYGLGNVAAPQEDLNSAQLNLLKYFWEELLTEAGATVEFKSVFATSASQNYNQKVSVVAFSDNENNTLGIDESIEAIATIHFEADQAKYLLPNSEGDQLAQIASLILDDPTSVWWIVGCTAGSTSFEDDTDVSLSQARSILVKDDLVALGVSEEQLRTVSAGSSSPWHMTDISLTSNTLIEVAAKENRVVKIFKDSDLIAESYYDFFLANEFIS